MDLLSGYGSDVSSDADAAPAQLEPILPPRTNPADQTPIVQQKKCERGVKQRRKLLALNAVLPPNIFEQLTKRQMQGENGDDSEEELTVRGKPRLSNNNASSGLTSLLDELRSVKTSNNSTTAAHSQKQLEARTGKTTAAQEEDEKLGFAFLNTKTVTERSSNSVVEIHGTDSHIKHDESIDRKSNPPGTSVSGGINRIPSVKAKIQPSIQAAPSKQATDVNANSAPQQTYYYPHSDEPPEISLVAAEETSRVQLSSRQRRKELERALRKGNLDPIFSASEEGVAEEVYQHVPSYRFDEYAHAQTTQAVQHKKGSVTVKMYDPRAGTTVDTKEVTSRHRAKHQIHQLAQSAIALEASRLTNPNKGSTSSTRADAKRKYGW